MTTALMTTTLNEWLKKCQYDQSTQCYEYEGCSYQTVEDIVQTGIFGFCGCGSQEDNLKYILEGLEYINWRLEDKTTDFNNKLIQQNEIFGNEKAAYFFYYWCDKEELTEHGGSVPGWLSPKGKLLVSILKTLKI